MRARPLLMSKRRSGGRPPVTTPMQICATMGVCVRGQMRASTGGSIQSRAATMTRRAHEKRDTRIEVTMPTSAARDTMYFIHVRPAQPAGMVYFIQR